MGTQIAKAMKIGSAQRPAPGVNVTLASAVGSGGPCEGRQKPPVGRGRAVR